METVINFFANIKIPVTIVHVISVVIGMGAALLSDILFNFFAKDKKLNPTERKTLEILSSVVWISLIVIILSGLALFASNPEKYLESPKFLAKLTILAILLINGFVLNAYVWKRLSKPGFFTAKRESGTRKIAFAGGAISVISWLSVCVLGVLDSSPVGYSVIIALYVCVLGIGIPTALLIENREFEK
jgi:hypothetical protein